MKKRNKNHSAPFKAKVALAAIKGDKTGAELANEFQVHTTQITQWRKLLKDSIIEIFSARRNKKDKENQELIDQLYMQVGQLTVELDWVKKSLDMTLDQKRLAIDCRHQKISVLRQCELLGMARSSLYYKPCRDTTYNEQLMRLLDEQYIETPFYGVDKMTH
jgi:putative transposase